ncbi:hypothetical protein HCD_05235 [Helicobacter cetorum MIT 99-5656]|uniref:site-specific DNA-methyltransferase (adenine-specific) n=2 Tax=Helicobacter cetorum TaxID=138563 RepID=I0ESY0_HELCM|nr:hypothetical protein HCD_05235 [Helicobacter cetorum MIT 99-5656]
MFRASKINKQINVPFIGACLLCMQYGIDVDTTSTKTIIRSIQMGLETIIDNKQPLTRKQKKEFLKTTLGDPTLNKAKDTDLQDILREINTIYHFINTSYKDALGHDIMSNFLRIFRRWNSVDANEKGEVFTPEHIADLMYDLAECSCENFILDPACGSGTFLITAMNRMFKEVKNIPNGDELAKDIKQNQLIGIEVNDFNATLAGLNVMLHGDGASYIYNEDCFKKLKTLINIYDRVLMNPPFALSNEKELEFVLETLKYLKNGGVLASILPKTCLKGKDSKELLDECLKISDLKMVVSLPSDLFQPNAGECTAIAIFHKTEKFHNSKTLLIDCSDDGFKLKDSNRECSPFWSQIRHEVLEAAKGNYDELRAIEVEIKSSDEILFEAFSLHRPLDISKDTFQKYLKEKIASSILCNEALKENDFKLISNLKESEYKRFKINDLLVKISNGCEKKSIERTLENKFIQGVPLVIAKKDNNGIGGLVEKPSVIFKDKFCIVTKGNGGGGKTFYLEKEFCATTLIMVCDLRESYSSMDKFAKFYLSVVVSERLFKTVSEGRTINEVPIIEVKLPIREDGNLNVEFMSDFIKQFEMARFL